MLNRINNELHANFDINQFDHYASYDPDNGACKSYLVSLKDQDVCIAENNIFHFKKDETIFMEISQKYSIEVIEKTALDSGFTPVAYFFDSNNYFTDVIWWVNKNSENFSE